jgi:hypothetical protein
MGDPRVASPILRRPARFGLAASDRGYAGCELRRILLPRTRVNEGEMRKCLILVNSTQQRSKDRQREPGA